MKDLGFRIQEASDDWDLGFGIQDLGTDIELNPES
jgi:hypothetical protein